MQTRSLRIILAGLGSLLVFSNAQGDLTLGEITAEAIRDLKDTNLGLLMTDPGSNLSDYSHLLMLSTPVAFKNNWQKNQNRQRPFKVKDEDVEEMKAGLKKMFNEVFALQLVSQGFELVTETGPGVLILRPAIVNLDIYAPETDNPTRVLIYTESAGEMTLYLELYDSVSGQLLARAKDRKRDLEDGYFEWQTPSSNRSAAKHMIKAWADKLATELRQAEFAVND